MANNGGRQGGGAGGNQNMNEHVEFTVKAGEDLYLTGSENTILRVAAETNYSCLMLKTQRFSSLFRHYAKYHGLRKDDLEYYFVNALENEDTPESVQLQRGDTIMVRKRRRPEPPEAAADDDEFYKDMRELLDDEEHMDAVFIVKAKKIRSSTTVKEDPVKTLSGNKRDSSGSVQFKPTSDSMVGSSLTTVEGDDDGFKTTVEGDEDDGIIGSLKTPSAKTVEEDDDDECNTIEVRAHRAILTARTEYFKAHFRKPTKDASIAFKENVRGVINVDPCFPENTIRLMLEFVYTNRIRSINNVSTNGLMLLLHLSDLWLIRDLKRLVEHELIRSHMDVNTVAKMYCATEDYHADRLSRACINFIMDNIHEVTMNVAFQDNMKSYPDLCIPILQAAADLIPEQPSHKKLRTSDHVASNAAALSSPVPDTDI